MKDMLYHTQAVAQATSQALLISDMPYQSYTSIMLIYYILSSNKVIFV
jgi:ketopantoate hydroxymethyltransferase